MKDSVWIPIIIADLITAATMLIGQVIDGEDIFELLRIFPVFLLIGLMGSFVYVIFLSEDIFVRIFFYSAVIIYFLFGYHFNYTLMIPTSSGPGNWTAEPQSLGVLLACGIPALLFTGILYGIYRIFSIIEAPILRRREKKKQQVEEQQALIRAEKQRQERIEKYKAEILSFSEGETTDIVFLINRNSETTNYIDKNKIIQEGLAEKKEAYEAALAGGFIKTVQISEAVIDGICEAIETELVLRRKSNAGAKKTLFEVYTKGEDPYSEVYTLGHLKKVLENAEKEGCKFNFALDKADWIRCKSEYWGFGGGAETRLTNDYFEWKKEYPDHLIIVSDGKGINNGIAHEKGALVLHALLDGYGEALSIGSYFVNGFDRQDSKGLEEPFKYKVIIESPFGIDGRTRPIAKVTAPVYCILPTLEKNQINYVLVENNKIVKRGDFGDNYTKFPASLYPGYRFSSDDFNEAYILEGNREERYYDGIAWRDVDDVAMKKKSYWRAQYPNAVIIEIKSNRYDSKVHVIDTDSECVLDALTANGWGWEEKRSAFRAAEILEDAKVNYVIIHSGKIEFENWFDEGKENYERYAKAGLAGEHMPSIPLKLKMSISHWEALNEFEDDIKEIEENLDQADSEEADSIIAHTMSKYRKKTAPDLAIKIFDKYEQFASDHMFVSVAAAYNDIMDYKNAMYYVEKASDGEYKDATKRRILRNRG